MNTLRRSLIATLAICPVLARATPANPAAREPGQALLLRHAATVPGVGDPPGWRLGDCSSQRNLSDAGRAQARQIGQALLKQAWRPSAVLSSRWCRCLDTGQLAFGRVQPWPALDSFFETRDRADAQTLALSQALLALATGERQVWVTHMVNIAALTGDSVGQGEGLLVRAERLADGQVRVQRLARFDGAQWLR